ncbi:MAG: hypothetical protein K6G10_01720 [Butyrivibrio sp.]|nr:hypothetical protein [Butyrivibrio sp.]
MDDIVKEKNINIILIYIYLAGYLRILRGVFNPSIVSYIYYVLIVFLFGRFLFNNRFIKRKVLKFYLLYSLLIVANMVLVQYKNLVAIEGWTNFIIALIPLYFFSLDVDLELFMNKWRRWANATTFSFAIILVLYYFKIVDYGVFALITVPNCLAVSWHYTHAQGDKILDFTEIVINVIITFIYGGRTATVATIAVFAFTFFVCKRLSNNKVIETAFIVVFAAVFMLNIEAIASNVVEIASALGIRSRNIYLLGRQLKKGGLFSGNIYTSNRDYIYDVALKFIKENNGRPGGIAIIRYLTRGRFYMAHNLLLELVITFGIYGAGLILLFILIKLLRLRKTVSKDKYQLIVMIGFCYLILSITGQSVFSNPIALCFLGLLIFGDKTYYGLSEQTEKVET